MHHEYRRWISSSNREMVKLSLFVKFLTDQKPYISYSMYLNLHLIRHQTTYSLTNKGKEARSLLCRLRVAEA